MRLIPLQQAILDVVGKYPDQISRSGLTSCWWGQVLARAGFPRIQPFLRDMIVSKNICSVL
jgi:hypothetical protein